MRETDFLYGGSNEYQPDTLHEMDVARFKSIISQYFGIYDVRWNEKTVAFYFTPNLSELENNFEQLRLRLKTENFTPKMTKEGGEYLIYILPSPKIKERSIWINIMLIILTIFTTTWAGSILWFGRMDIANNSSSIIEPILNSESVLFGFLSFALPLMVILGTHETAHYLAAKRHNINASLPYFIPLPPPFILGTMGAFISMREPISNKKALLDIGAAGPIAGFIVTIPIVLIGFYLEGLQPVALAELPKEVYIFNEPLLFSGLRTLFPSGEDTLMHPTAFAGWVGLFVTALNLIPGGQLDGGHISRALLGSKAKYLSFIVIISLFVLSFTTLFPLWIFFALFILLMGSSHPPPLNDFSPLGNKRRAIGAFCMVMLILCIHYAPISIVSLPDYELEFECENNNQVVTINGTAIFEIKVNNIGEIEGDVEFSVETKYSNSSEGHWQSEFQLFNNNNERLEDWNNFNLKEDEFFLIKIEIRPRSNINHNSRIDHHLVVNISGLRKLSSTYKISTHIGNFDLITQMQNKKVTAGEPVTFKINAKNLADQINIIDLEYNLSVPDNTTGWNAFLNPASVNLLPMNENDNQISIYFTLDTPSDLKTGTKIKIDLIGRSRLNSLAYDNIELSIEIA